MTLHATGTVRESDTSVPWDHLVVGAAVVLGIAVLALVALFAVDRWAKMSRRRKELAAARERLRAHQQVQDQKWADLLRLEDELSSEWLRYETDLHAMMSRPLMRNLADPRVQRVVEAMSRARALRQVDPPQLESVQDVVYDLPYPRAVREFRDALSVAQDAAVKEHKSAFTREERKRISQAQQILRMAEDEGNGDARQMYYERVLKLLDGLVDVPQKAVQQIEASLQQTLQIEPPKCRKTPPPSASEPARPSTSRAPWGRRLLRQGLALAGR